MSKIETFDFYGIICNISRNEAKHHIDEIRHFDQMVRSQLDTNDDFVKTGITDDNGTFYGVLFHEKLNNYGIIIPTAIDENWSNMPAVAYEGIEMFNELDDLTIQEIAEKYGLAIKDYKDVGKEKSKNKKSKNNDGPVNHKVQSKSNDGRWKTTFIQW